MAYCRVCLNKGPEKDITQLKIHKKIKEESYTQIMKFCLGIQVEHNSTVCTKICLKCYRKIIAFYKFKTLALKNDVYFKSLDVKNEIFLDDDDTYKVNCEEPIDTRGFLDEDDTKKENCEEELTLQVKLELNNDTSVKAESPVHDYISSSEDEYLSVIRKIKYEYMENDTKEVDTCELTNSNTKKNVKKNKGKKLKIVKPKTIKQMCAECGKTVTDLKAHSYSHQPVAVRKRIKCHGCDLMFSSYGARNRHNKSKHLGVKEICNICNKTVNNIRQHRRVVHNKESLPHECSDCGQRFLFRGNLDVHRRTHTKDKPFGCEECDKTFAYNALLQQHIRSVHKNEKSHLCQVCSKSFFKKYHLQMHMACHSNDKKHECPECGKFFKTVSTLKGHLVIHIEEKNFTCELCAQTFKKKDYLLAHMLSHNKIKRYECQYCGVKFHRSDHRKRHEYTAHQKHLVTEDATVATSTTPPPS